NLTCPGARPSSTSAPVRRSVGTPSAAMVFASATSSITRAPSGAPRADPTSPTKSTSNNRASASNSRLRRSRARAGRTPTTLRGIDRLDRLELSVELADRRVHPQRHAAFGHGGGGVSLHHGERGHRAGDDASRIHDGAVANGHVRKD